MLMNPECVKKPYVVSVIPEEYTHDDLVLLFN